MDTRGEVFESLLDCQVLFPLTEQNDDADENGDDGPRAQASSCHGSCSAAVPAIVTGTDFDSDQRAVGQRRIP